MANRQPNEDLFENTRMSFGEHIEELRRVLVRTLYGLAISCVIGFYLANHVVEFLQQPLKDAIAEFKMDRAKDQLKAKSGGFVPPELVPRMEKEKLIPQTVEIDPAQLIKVLRSVSPSHLSEVDLTPYRFVAAEIKTDQIGQLAERWINGDGERIKNNRNQQLDFLRDLLSVEQRQQMEALIDSDLEAEKQTQQLLLILNSLIDRQTLYEADAFDEILTEKKISFFNFWSKEPDNTLASIRTFVERNGSVDDKRRLNHLLISNVFAEELNPPQIAMSKLQIWQSAEVNPQSLTAPEVFMIWVKAGVITGLFLGSPWLFYQIWSFVAAGLYKHEQRYVYIYLPFSLALFFAGAALSFFFVFKPVLSFLFQFNAGMGIEPQPRIGDWLSFVMFLPLGFGIAFQLPLVMLVLNRIGLFEIESYLNKWRVAILVIFVVSMFLTPADPISLILLAVPLSILYFLGIALCKWMPSGRNPFGDAVYEP